MNREEKQKLERDMSRKGRMVALVIAGTMVIWFLGTRFVAYMGWPVRFISLLDMAAIAAFVWIFVVIWQIWRMRQQLNENGPR